MLCRREQRNQNYPSKVGQFPHLRWRWNFSHLFPWIQVGFDLKFVEWLYSPLALYRIEQQRYCWSTALVCTGCRWLQCFFYWSCHGAGVHLNLLFIKPPLCNRMSCQTRLNLIEGRTTNSFYLMAIRCSFCTGYGVLWHGLCGERSIGKSRIGESALRVSWHMWLYNSHTTEWIFRQLSSPL